MAIRGTKEWKENIGKARSKVRVKFFCEFCKKESSDRPSHFRKKKRHYCSMKCYADDRRDNWKPEEQSSWRGGVSQTESHRRWKKKNPERMAHLKARRYAREKNAEGSHTFEEWQKLKQKHDHKCFGCGESKKLTKDHIIPLSEGGSDFITNIQPMCRNCNSRKWKHIHENPELLKSA